MSRPTALARFIAKILHKIPLRHGHRHTFALYTSKAASIRKHPSLAHGAPQWLRIRRVNSFRGRAKHPALPSHRVIHRRIRRDIALSLSRVRPSPTNLAVHQSIRPAKILPDTDDDLLSLSSISQSVSYNHGSLTSFLAYAKRRGLSPTSPVYKGTYYEYSVAHAVLPFGLVLKRVGGAHDGGIDLWGRWWLDFDSRLPARPSLAKKSQQAAGEEWVYVAAQCKGVGGKVSPALVRELEGALAVFKTQLRARDASKPVLGLLITTQPSTPGVRAALTKSEYPLGFVCVTFPSDTTLQQAELTARVMQFNWNRAATKALDLYRLGVVVQYPAFYSPNVTALEASDDRGKQQSRLALTLDGCPLTPYQEAPSLGPNLRVVESLAESTKLVKASNRAVKNLQILRRSIFNMKYTMISFMALDAFSAEVGLKIQSQSNRSSEAEVEGVMGNKKFQADKSTTDSDMHTTNYNEILKGKPDAELSPHLVGQETPLFQHRNPETSELDGVGAFDGLVDGILTPEGGNTRAQLTKPDSTAGLALGLEKNPIAQQAKARPSVTLPAEQGNSLLQSPAMSKTADERARQPEGFDAILSQILGSEGKNTAARGSGFNPAPGLALGRPPSQASHAISRGLPSHMNSEKPDSPNAPLKKTSQSEQSSPASEKSEVLEDQQGKYADPLKPREALDRDILDFLTAFQEKTRELLPLARQIDRAIRQRSWMRLQDQVQREREEKGFDAPPDFSLKIGATGGLGQLKGEGKAEGLGHDILADGRPLDKGASSSIKEEGQSETLTGGGKSLDFPLSSDAGDGGGIARDEDGVTSGLVDRVGKRREDIEKPYPRASASSSSSSSTLSATSVCEPLEYPCGLPTQPPEGSKQGAVKAGKDKLLQAATTVTAATARRKTLDVRRPGKQVRRLADFFAKSKRWGPRSMLVMKRRTTLR